MLQAVIPLEAFRAELRRRCERIRSHRPFGKTIGSFCGPAQAPAVEIQPPQGAKIMRDSTMNPMIGDDGSVFKVASVLKFVSNMFADTNPKLDDDGAIGLSVILDCAVAAIWRMESLDPKEASGRPGEAEGSSHGA